MKKPMSNEKAEYIAMKILKLLIANEVEYDNYRPILYAVIQEAVRQKNEHLESVVITVTANVDTIKIPLPLS